MTGRVKWFDDKRGYGFITTDGYRTLKHNWRVDFEVVTAEDGRPEARSVVVLPKITPRKESRRHK